LLYPEQLEKLGFKTDGQHIAVFPNLAFVQRFDNLGEQPEILLAGFPYFVKGVDLLIDAFCKLSPSFPEWQLTILGHYPDKSCFSPEALRHPRIQVLDPVPHSQMPAFMGRCGIFALPSRSEALGRVLLEAMAAGKPRVSTSVGGIPTTIDSGIDGILIPPNDVKALYSALKRLIESPELRRRLGENGAKRARIEFSSEAYLQNTKTFYDQLLDLDSPAISPVSKNQDRRSRATG
jgi:glycosyltransferase involved in cell wall biosynthesis